AFFISAGNDPQLLRNAAALFGGCITEDAAYAADPEISSGALPLALDILRASRSSEAPALSRRVTDFCDFNMLLRVLSVAARDVLAAQAGAGLLLKTRKNDILTLSEAFSARAAVSAQDFVGTAALRLKFNGNPVSVADELLFNIMEVKALCRS
ncbi:MAG: hypothetical protein FWE62_02990, partial [Firmicutes bacterium]|nr:hypothetical protein [Bacillota bacterium]